MKEQIIDNERSVIVAADVSPEDLSPLVKATCVVEGIGGYKVGLELALQEGLPMIASMVKDHTELPVIYDHQKAGNDTPHMGPRFAKVCRESGIDAVILFPFGGAKTERDWIKACQDKELGVLVGAHMTQPEFLVSEGGFVADDSPDRIFTIAAQEGVQDFVVPGNKIEHVAHYRELLENILGENNFTFYAPGFIAQGGKISEVAKVAGDRWHAIVGRGIYQAVYPRAAAEEMTSNL